MADNWASWYQGGMTPPLALPGGGYVPAPLSMPQMSVDDMYRGIYPSAAPPALTTRQVQTVSIDPSTGMPYVASSPSMSAQASFGGAGMTAGGRLPMSGMSASGGANSALGAIGRATGNIGAGGVRDLGAPQYGTPGQGGGVLGTGGLPANAYTAKLFTDRLTPPFSMAAGARGSSGISAAGGGRMSLNAPSMSPPASTDVIRLAFDPMSETSGQNMANSAGRPVAGPSGKTYYPTNQATDRVRAPMSPVAERAAQKPTGLFGGLFGGTGGLFGGGMFGGGQQAPRNPAGLPIATSGPVINGATYGITATGSVGDYGSSPGQITAGLQPGERKFDASTNSWGLR